MFELLMIIILLVIVFFIFKTAIKQITQKPEQIKFNFKVYFINGYQNYNNITLIKKGECIFKIEDGNFYFEQDGNIIEDNIFDIYNIRTWTFEDYVYLAIKTKTSSEYKFSLMIKNNVESSIEKTLLLGFLKSFENLCKKLKVDFIECGESQPLDEHDEDEIDEEE